MNDPQQDAIEAYDLAMDRVRKARAEWLAEGEPFTLKQPNGMQGGHPLWKSLLEAEAFAARLREQILGRTTTGRPTGAASAADRKPPERVKLKVLQKKNTAWRLAAGRAGALLRASRDLL